MSVNEEVMHRSGQISVIRETLTDQSIAHNVDLETAMGGPIRFHCVDEDQAERFHEFLEGEVERGVAWSV